MKKKISLVMAVILMLSVFPISEQIVEAGTEKVVNGDADKSGACTVEDLVRVKRSLANQDVTVESGGDVNEDDAIQDNDCDEIRDLLVDRKIDTEWYTQNPNATSFELSTRAELVGFANLISQGTNSKTFKGQTITLKNKICMNRSNPAEGEETLNIADYQGSIPKDDANNFNGTFDGQNYAISGMVIESTNSDYCGLFPMTGSSAVIQNVSLEKCVVSGKRRVGGLVARADNGLQVDNVSIQGDVSSAQWECGGLIGEACDVINVSNSLIDCNISSTTQTSGNPSTAGGLIGNANASSATAQTGLHCTNVKVLGSISNTEGSNTRGCGGLIGLMRENAALSNYALTLDNVAVGATISASAYQGKLIGSTTYGSRKTGTIVDDFKNVYVLDTDMYAFGDKESALELQNGGLALVDSTADIPQGITGKDEGYMAAYTAEKTFVPDTSWYDTAVAAETTAVTLQDEADFLGFMQLMSRTTPVTFSGWTITLGADIVFNEGDVVARAEQKDDQLFNLRDYQAQKKSFGAFSSGFQGIFDGAGHVISGIYLHDDSTDASVAIFPMTGQSAVLKNFTLTNSYIYGYRYTGGLIGRAANGLSVTNVNVHASVNVAKWEAGGLVGEARGRITMTDCTMDVDVKSVYTSSDQCSAGGLIGNTGSQGSVNLTNVRLNGTVSCPSNGAAGGIIGLIRGDSTTTWEFQMSNVAIGNEIGGGGKAGLFIGNASYGINSTHKCTIGDTISNLYVLSGNNTLDYIGITPNSTNSAYLAVDLSDVVKIEKTLTEMKALVNKPAVSTAWYTEDATEYRILTDEQFLGFQSLIAQGDTSVTFAGKKIYLETDVVLNEDAMESITLGTVANYVDLKAYRSNSVIPLANAFQGSFDGKGHVISGVYLKESGSSDKAALFPMTSDNAEIKNLNVENSYIYGVRYTGGLVGQHAKLSGTGILTIQNVSYSGFVTAAWREAGGLIGEAQNTVIIKDSTVNATISGDGSSAGDGGFGGLIGHINSTTPNVSLENVLVKGTVSCVMNESKSRGAGLLFGLMREGANKGVSTDMAFTLNMNRVGVDVALSADTGVCVGTIVGQSTYGKRITGTITDNARDVYVVNKNEGLHAFGETGVVIKCASAIQEASADDMQEAPSITCVTFNVLGEQKTDYADNAVRANAIVDMLKASDADIIGIQEACTDYSRYSSVLNYDWTDEFYTALTTNTEYAGYKINDDQAFVDDLNGWAPFAEGTYTFTDGNTYTNDQPIVPIGSGLIILYRKDRFDVVEKGVTPYRVGCVTRYNYDFTYDVTLDNGALPSNQWRSYQWMKLKDKLTGEIICVTNTHWSVNSDAATETNKETLETVTSTGLMLRRLQAETLLNCWNTAETDVVIGFGDYNCDRAGSASLLAAGTDYRSSNGKANSVDHIFYNSTNLVLEQFGFVEGTFTYTDSTGTEQTGCAYSDHQPYKIEVSYK